MMTTSDTETTSEDEDEEGILDKDPLFDEDIVLELEDVEPPSVTDKTRINKIVKTTALESLG